MIPVVLLGRPVITNEYHARLKSLGLDPAEQALNPVPAPDSVQAKCGRCDDPIWLGPNQQTALAEYLTAGDDLYRVSIECLLCGYLETVQEADSVHWVSLSDD